MSTSNQLRLIALCLFAGLSFWLPIRIDAADITTTLIVAVCGDSVVSSGEACDYGPSLNVGGYGSSTAERQCLPNCTGFDAYCGDSILQARYTESCDDGNNTDGDFCSAQCVAAVSSNPGGSTSGGGSNSSGGGSSSGVERRSDATAGEIDATLDTKLVIRGKAHPGASVSVLMDGKSIGSVTADSNANFLFTTTGVTPGTATFGFMSKDGYGANSLMTSAVFTVLQSAITNLNNILIPPIFRLSSNKIDPGSSVTVTGETVPEADVDLAISGSQSANYQADADGGGRWSLQLDTATMPAGLYNFKASFLNGNLKSGYGKAISLAIGDVAVPSGEAGTIDINGDSRVNLVDFSIFLTTWNSADGRGDFNSDGKVNLADFSIMLFRWTG